MRLFLLVFVMLLTACAEQEPEVYKASANVDDESIEALFDAIGSATGDTIDGAEVARFVAGVPMDEEKQHRLEIEVGGNRVELGVHYWREQSSWVHVYASSPSQDAIRIFEKAARPFARDAMAD